MDRAAAAIRIRCDGQIRQARLFGRRRGDHLSITGGRLSHYAVAEPVGEGGMGVVYRGRELRLRPVDFLIRSGRAVLYQVYKGTYERGGAVAGPNAFRDLTIARVKDVRRSMEYLATRQDIDMTRVGFYGVSMGAFNGIFSTALEPRFKASILLGSGLTSGRYSPEIDPLNFLPRVQTPTLLVNGKNDFAYPLETSQRPLIQLLGTREKELASFEGGHILVRVNEVVRVLLDWFDKHLGPVALSAD